MSKHFTHLHLHTDHSLLDGAITIDKLVNFGKQNNMKSLAITDHGNIFAAVKFFNQAKKAGIKPILGMEAYFTQDISRKIADDKYNHLILLVQNQIGYKNLCKLISFAYQEGFYFKPRIDYEILKRHSEGLIATTACLGGHIPSLLMGNKEEEAHQKIDWFLDVFGKDRFFLEVQPEDQKEQKILNQKLFEIANQRDLNLLATADCHYVYAEDREAHEIMLAIQTHAKITDPNRFTFGDCRSFMRTEQEMLTEFKKYEHYSNWESAIWNSGFIADQCNFDFPTGKLFFPEFEIPKESKENTNETYFAALSRRGLQALIDNNRIEEDFDKYWARLELEIDLITKMGYIGYFLIVSDFIVWAKNNDIPVGPGRGSAAGSLVAWALQITDIDPLKYNLLFERFLNPERVSMPDIDIDFCIEGRERVIDYVREKYGHDKVCQIITFGTMAAKGALKDVARTLGFPYEDANNIVSLIPEQLKITLDEAIEQEAKLKDLIKSNSQVAHLFEIAKKLEGTARHASKHAAGIVISPEAISDVLPVYIPPKSTDLVTQYEMVELEILGFLKMDFLGLKNLTVIDRVVKLIKSNRNIDIDILKLPLDDAKTYDLLSKGQTSGVFQLESSGLKDVLRRLKPTNFEDIIAVNALYRPGPLGSGMVDDFIERKQGRQEIKYIFPELESVLKDTYGVIVYQEQVMKIASEIAGYSLGEADILRRAMGKKKAEVMAEQRAIFVEKSIARNFDAKKSGELFDLMAYFAGYGFNKSHSAAYALIAYQTAYLKSNYPVEFLSCLISIESDDVEKMAFYISEAKDMGIAIEPPDINKSEIYFTAGTNSIRFGLKGVKNVGLISLENIIKEQQIKKFSSLLDFCMRLDLRTTNKRVIENLICSGAFDNLPGNRAQKFEELGKIMETAIQKKKNLSTGQMGLFEFAIAAISNNSVAQEEHYNFAPKDDWQLTEKLEKEKEVMGLYVSAQPLDAYKDILRWTKPTSLKLLPDFAHESFINVVGTVKSLKVITTKKGDKMAFAQIEDYEGKTELVIFPKTFAKSEAWLHDHTLFFIKGIVDSGNKSSNKIIAHTIIPLDLIFENYVPIEQLSIKLPTDLKSNYSTLVDIKSILVAGSTKLEVLFIENNKNLKLNSKVKVRVSSDLLIAIEAKNLEVELKF